MDVLYAMPGDLNYSYGPKGDALERLTADRPQTASFTVSYTGFSPAAQAAFQSAINILSVTMTSAVPIRVRANWTPLASGVLGSAGATIGCTVPTGPFAGNTFYAAALADKINGSAFCAALVGETHEIQANFNSSFADWEFGTTGVPVSGKYNFMTVVLHEVVHGLGFFGRMTSNGTTGTLSSSLPYIYDQFAVTGTNISLLDTGVFPRPSTQLHDQLTSDNTWFQTNTGVKIETANFATKYGMLGTADGWLQGSSYSHVDFNSYVGTPNGLQCWALNSNTAYTDIGRHVRTIFTLMGWTVNSLGVRLGDYTGDGIADMAVFRPSTGQFFVSGLAPALFGLPGDVPVVGDFNGNGTNDIAVFRPSDGTWYVNGLAAVQFGIASDLPVPADYNGDGITDRAVFRTVNGMAGQFLVHGLGSAMFGLRGDIPVPADFDGDHIDDLAVYRPWESKFYVRLSTTLAVVQTTFGLPGDVPVVGYFDNDVLADYAVYRTLANGTAAWYLKLSTGTTPIYSFGLANDIPSARDIDNDGADELVLWRPSNGTWYRYNRISASTTTQSFGLLGDIPVHGRPRLPFAPNADFDGDGRSDITVYRPSDQVWYTKTSSSGFATNVMQQWGINGDLRVPGDYDGDHKTDHAVFRPSNSTWYIRRSSDGVLLQRQFGLSGDVAMPGDYDGDSITDIAVFRPTGAFWYILRSTTNFTQTTQLQWGISTDTPIVGDFDGDGRVDLTVYRSSNQTWFIRPSSPMWGALIQRQWGVGGDVPAVADFDGDGRTDMNVFRPSNQTWYELDALLGANIRPPLGTQWGVSGDTPVPHDYDGDGRADVTVFRPAQGQWWISRSSNGALLFVTWGLPADGPVLRKGQ
jgi:hypothetical protein